MTDWYYRRSKDVASRVLDGEAILIKMPENLFFTLSPSGSGIWVRADGTRRVAELCKGPDESVVQAFLDEMTSRGLLERSSTPAESPDVFPQDVNLPETYAEAPEIRTCEPIEVLAGVCNSAWDGQMGCRIATCTYPAT